MKLVDEKIIRAQRALNLVRETFHAIEVMEVGEREYLMRVLRMWLLAEPFGQLGSMVVSGFHNYCVAECLQEDANWRPTEADTPFIPKH